MMMMINISHDFERERKRKNDKKQINQALNRSKQLECFVLTVLCYSATLLEVNVCLVVESSVVEHQHPAQIFNVE